MDIVFAVRHIQEKYHDHNYSLVDLSKAVDSASLVDLWVQFWLSFGVHRRLLVPLHDGVFARVVVNGPVSDLLLAANRVTNIAS